MAQDSDKLIAELTEKLIAEAHTKITRTKGKEYSPTADEIQKMIEMTAVEFGILFWNHKNPNCQINLNKLTTKPISMSENKLELKNKLQLNDAFGITFMWKGKESKIQLVNGEDILKLPILFSKFLKENGIETKIIDTDYTDEPTA